MFLEKYLSEVKFNLLLDTYEEFYLNDLDEEKFLEIYNLFKKYNFYFVDDIILNYLEIFFMNKDNLLSGKYSLLYPIFLSENVFW